MYTYHSSSHANLFILGTKNHVMPNNSSLKILVTSNLKFYVPMTFSVTIYGSDKSRNKDVSIVRLHNMCVFWGAGAVLVQVSNLINMGRG